MLSVLQLWGAASDHSQYVPPRAPLTLVSPRDFSRSSRSWRSFLRFLALACFLHSVQVLSPSSVMISSPQLPQAFMSFLRYCLLFL